MDKLKTNKLPGPYCIQQKVLRECNRKTADFQTKIYINIITRIPHPSKWLENSRCASDFYQDPEDI